VVCRAMAVHTAEELSTARRDVQETGRPRQRYPLRPVAGWGRNSSSGRGSGTRPDIQQLGSSSVAVRPCRVPRRTPGGSGYRQVLVRSRISGGSRGQLGVGTVPRPRNVRDRTLLLLRSGGPGAGEESPGHLVYMDRAAVRPSGADALSNPSPVPLSVPEVPEGALGAPDRSSRRAARHDVADSGSCGRRPSPRDQLPGWLQSFHIGVLFVGGAHELARRGTSSRGGVRVGLRAPFECGKYNGRWTCGSAHPSCCRSANGSAGRCRDLREVHAEPGRGARWGRRTAGRAASVRARARGPGPRLRARRGLLDLRVVVGRVESRVIVRPRISGCAVRPTPWSGRTG